MFITSQPADAKVKIYGLNSSQAAELNNGNTEANKIYQVDFDGDAYSQGIYFYKFTTNDNSYMDRLILIK